MNSFDFSSNIQNGLDYAAGTSSAMGEGEMGILAFLMSFLLSFGLVLLLTLPIVIFQYVFTSISLQTLSRRRKVSKPWLAWIPYCSTWLLGAIASDYDKQNGKHKRWGRRLITTYLLEMVLLILGYAGYLIGVIFAESSTSLALVILLIALAVFLVDFVFAILYAVFYYICIYKIFKSTAGDLAWLFLLLAIFVPISLPICLFVFRNKGYEVMTEDNLIVEQV